MNIKLVPKFRNNPNKISEKYHNFIYTDGTKIPAKFINFSRIDGYPIFEVDTFKIPNLVIKNFLQECILENVDFEFENVKLSVLKDDITKHRDKKQEIVDLILQSFGVTMEDLESDESFDTFIRELQIKFLE